MTPEQAAPYLAAMLEAEGHVTPVGSSHQVRISNTSPFVLNQIAYCFDLFGIPYGSYNSGSGVFAIRVTARRNFMRLLEVCGRFMVTHKKERLIRLTAESPLVRQKCGPACRCRKHTAGHRRGPKPDRRRWDLARQMSDEGMAVSAIARAMTTSRSYVYTMLREGGKPHS